MNKIINGKKYNTETAEMVGKYWNGYDSGNFYYIYEELYRKKTGEFFLYGSGGPLTEYSERYGNMRLGSSRIIPYSINEAKEWAMEHMDADAFEDVFGAVEE